MSSESECPTNDAFTGFKENLRFAVYYVIMPCYFIIGMSGNATLLLAFRRQAKKDKAYVYQIFFTISKTLEIFFSSIFWWGYKWHAGVESPGTLWYMNNYILMFFSAHVGCPLSNGFIISSLLFSVAMTSDRVFALGKPFVYKGIKAKKHHAVAASLCVFIGLSTSAFEVNRWHVVSGSNSSNASFMVRYNEEYLSMAGVMALGHLRTAVRLVSLAALIVLNAIMLVIYRRRSRKVGQMTGPGNKKERERRAADKALLVITVCQSCLTAFSHIPHSIYFIAAFISVKVDLCYGAVVASIADACICIGDAADVFIIIGSNQKMRRAVFRVLPCCTNEDTSVSAFEPGTTTAVPTAKRASYSTSVNGMVKRW